MRPHQLRPACPLPPTSSCSPPQAGHGTCWAHLDAQAGTAGAAATQLRWAARLTLRCSCCARTFGHVIHRRHVAGHAALGGALWSLRRAHHAQVRPPGGQDACSRHPCHHSCHGRRYHPAPLPPLPLPQASPLLARHPGSGASRQLSGSHPPRWGGCAQTAGCGSWSSRRPWAAGTPRGWPLAQCCCGNLRVEHGRVRWCGTPTRPSAPRRMPGHPLPGGRPL
jgi:hypothetical protein